MGIFIYAFTATGKTTAAKKFKNVIDMESSIYKYVNFSGDEKLKSTERILNENWPNNYFNALLDVKDKYDYILIADDICNDFLHINNFSYWYVYPDKSLKDEYMNRCRNRGNNEEFIYYYNKYFDKWIDDCEKDIYAVKKIKLRSNEFLEDVLNDEMIKK